MTQDTALVRIDKKTAEATVKSHFGGLEKMFNKSRAEAEKAKAVVLVQAGFDPMFHLALYEDSIIVTKPGANWWLRREDHCPGAQAIPFPIPPAEKAAYGLKEDEIGVVTKIYLPGQTVPVATGFGKASTRPYTYQRPGENASAAEKAAAKAHPDRRRNPIDAEHPYTMAEKRSEMQAVFKLVPLEGFNPEVDSRTIETTARVVTVEDVPPAHTEPPAPPPTNHPDVLCSEHKVMAKWFERDSAGTGPWYSHKLDGGLWCKKRPAEMFSSVEYPA